MRRGRHCATFTLLTPEAEVGSEGLLGVVAAGFDPTTDDGAHLFWQGWMLSWLAAQLIGADRDLKELRRNCDSTVTQL